MVFYEDFRKSPSKVLDEIYEYLDIENINCPDVREKHMQARYFVPRTRR